MKQYPQPTTPSRTTRLIRQVWLLLLLIACPILPASANPYWADDRPYYSGPRERPYPRMMQRQQAPYAGSGDYQLQRNQDSGETISIPVKVHLYSFAAAPELNATLKKGDVKKLFDEVNAVWKQAGIQWKVGEVTRREVSAGVFPAPDDRLNRLKFRRQIVEASPARDAKLPWAVAIMASFPIPGGGVYLPETRTVFYAQRNKFGEAHAEILAHELGHTLGLQHVQDTDNLMQASNAGGGAEQAKQLTAEQIATARAQALSGQPSAGRRRGKY
jgi:hypothetical protein